ncbi:MAG: iron ABC transporter permease [Burkholderiales bacterium]
MPVIADAPGLLRAPRSRGVSAVTGWRVALFTIAVLATAPLAVIFASFLTPADDVWRHFASTILSGLIFNTVVLAVAVGAASAMIGVGLAWLVAVCEFPGRRLFSWALILPLAIPAYVFAFVVVGLFDFTGPLQTWLRGITGSNLTWLPEVRSRGGIIIVMTLALYPYVYLLARNAFRTQGKRMLEAGRILGLSSLGAFIHVALPMARPWIAAGMSLVLMETLADFGAVSVFNYDTLTIGIYKAWYGMFSLTAASQIASILVLVALVVLLLEQYTRSRMRFSGPGASGEAPRIVLAGWHRWVAVATCTAVLSAGFIIPVIQLAVWAAQVAGEDLDARYLSYLWRTLFLAGLAATAICAVSLLLGYATRKHSDLASRLALRFSTLGYAVPGAVLAVGIFICFAWMDARIPDWLRAMAGLSPGALLQGSVMAMLCAYVIRFLAVGFGPIEGALHRITHSVDEASVLLGQAGWRLLARVHLPMLRRGLAAGAILVFIDVMKEMPITLMTRPFGWDTLAVRIFELTSEGQWERAALPAVVLVIAGIVPLVQLTSASE